jgi:replicative DNA helicase
MIEERYSEMARETISTPWDTINDLTQGGLAKGELGVVVAPAGAGKTWVLAKIGSEALKKQKCIIHFTLELNEAYVGLRYDSIFTGIANQNLKYHKEEVEKKLQKFETGKLLIKYFPTKSASIHTFSAYLKRLIAIGEKIDLVVIDYADLMQDASKAKEVRHQLGNIYDDLRGLAGEFEVPVWTASQTNRSALEDDIIEAQKISESYQKVMTADFVMSLSRKIEDKTQNTGRFHVIKNRFGPDGLTYPARVNTNTGQIELYESDSLGGKEQQKKIDNRDRVSRKMLATKYKDLIE